MLQGIIDELYATAPAKPLYHYTSLQGLLRIVRSKVLWASEVHYLNDAEELKCFANSINGHISRRLEAEDPQGHPVAIPRVADRTHVPWPDAVHRVLHRERQSVKPVERLLPSGQGRKHRL